MATALKWPSLTVQWLPHKKQYVTPLLDTYYQETTMAFQFTLFYLEQMLVWKKEELNRTKIIYSLLMYIYQFLGILMPTVVYQQ